MSVESSSSEQTCDACGNAVPPGARYCPSCGACLAPVGDAGSQSFEDAIASVLGDDPGAAPPPLPPTETEPDAARTFEPVSASPPPAPPASWSIPAQHEPTGWATYPPPASEPGGRNRTLWIVLAIFGFIVFCCCGLVFVSVAVAAPAAASAERVIRALA